ncbi:hypothetical protein ACMU_10480 [Actibacterium mucosum KCTC 23349]|uniref:Pentapeptide repeat-containing protein n=1 Tax=Actibacterium mucosum KCTC 23349 TaxID=1454373 RepID=A0A037ZKJ9_9RHOB|nr:pentapeptide repeat-containing protein [Actibacterium mucosum]KAJ56169.1 hypothetical protein ACMU_10480 [Actibacterium mucosum KCTC 23349]
MADLTPANRNPWYVLATLYGEQEGEIDWELEQRNRRVWNAWACQNMSPERRAEVAVTCRIDVEETEGWDAIADEVARLHKEEMQTRNGDGFPYPGLPDPSDVMDCSKTHFPKSVVLEKRVFASAAYFDSATFSADANFESATFSADANFVSANFVSAAFSADAYFDSATFSAEANFDSATFSDVAYFSSATFSADAYFDSATFSADANFVSAAFSADANFDSATFDGPVFFDNSEFGTAKRSKPAPVTFAGAQFARPTSFRLAKFHQTFPDLSGAILHDQTTFTARDGHWPVQIDRPKDQDALIAARESAATIRHVVGKQGLPEDEHFFFRKEMGFARRVGSIWQRLPYFAFWVFSNYGYSIARPMRWLALLFTVPSLYYGCYFFGQNGASLTERFLGAVGLSFSSIFNFFGFQRSFFRDEIDQFDTVMALLSGTQTVMGYILLFFLALGLRQRFRLR